MKYLIAMIVVISIFLAGCSNEIEKEEQNIIVEKRIGNEFKYVVIHEITNNKQVDKVRDILDGGDWQNAKVDMVRPADFRFNFYYTNPRIVQEKNDLYGLWISPKKDKVELVIETANKYIQLDKDTSAELFEIVTGVKLTDQ